MQEPTQHLDVRGLNCPLPILRTKRQIGTMAQGETLEITATDPGSVKDMQAFCRQTGHDLLSSDESDAGFVFSIRKN